MATLNSLVSYLNSLLNTEAYQDYGINGLQVESAKNQTVSKVCVAVDAGESIIDRAIEAQADMLLVHHGLFWGGPQSITGSLGRKIEKLLSSGCSLYASHLPLDGNMEVGNAAGLGRILELENIEPAFPYKGMTIGITARANPELSSKDIVSKLAGLPGIEKPLVLEFSNSPAKNIAIITGSGSSALEECKTLGMDTLITGEPKQEAYHLAKELGLTAIFIGHYASETIGVRLLADRIKKDLDIETEFLDEPTGI